MPKPGRTNTMPRLSESHELGVGLVGPEGPSTQHVRSLVPNSNIVKAKGMVLETRCLKSWVRLGLV